MVFTDRLLVTLVHLRTGLPHAALAALYGTACSTVSRALCITGRERRKSPVRPQEIVEIFGEGPFIRVHAS
ncbi:transposase family protein [Streptomyces sp. NPDC057557]|uniref:transposase family protein n=1 Tax=Streptomyces sp. NPDC057557 TaxID=3346167 RepID=UPI0036C706DA